MVWYVVVCLGVFVCDGGETKKCSCLHKLLFIEYD